MEGKSVRECIFELTKSIPKGYVSTYGEIAKLAKTSPRAVGAILHSNHSKDIPCHRVVMSNGNVGGFARGVKEKVRLLKSEGVKIRNDKVIEKFFHLCVKHSR